MKNYEKLLEEVRKLGMDYKWAKMFIKKFKTDESLCPDVDDDTKKWALEHGFAPGYVETYGLTDENYKNFVPDYNYFMLHPMNNHFRKWLDKTTLKYVLNSNGCESVMPDYYLYIENDGCYTYLMNCPSDIEKNKDFLLNLLIKEGILAMKPNSGTSGGLGFIKLEYNDGIIYENNNAIDMKRFEEIRDSMRNYIVTEYIHQNHELDRVWDKSECTLRVIMAKTPKKDLYKEDEWFCVNSFARFGTSASGGASNLSAGGFGVGFDYSTGICNGKGMRARTHCKETNDYKVYAHPDTKVSLDGYQLPNWEYVKEKIERVCKHITSLEYLGLDIIITDDGMKICEINSHPALDLSQTMGSRLPLTDPRVREFFEHKGLFKVDTGAFYKAYLRC